MVQALGEFSTLLAIADPEQRIYDFIGADPERLNHFRAAFRPTEMDLSTDNHRSAGTDIGIFGNDLLSGRFRKKSYDGIDCLVYEPYSAQAMTALVTTARKRLVDAGRKNWSLAILVPTKKMTHLVSDTFRAPPAGMTEIPHVAAIEFEAAILGAAIIAFLMQPNTDGQHFEQFIALMRNYLHGKGGDAPTQAISRRPRPFRKPTMNGWSGKRPARKSRRTAF